MKIHAMAVLMCAAVAFPALATARDLGAGRIKASQCQGCHGNAGISVAPMYPNLAGQKEVYLRKAMRDFKTGARRDPQCSSVLRTLNDADIDDLARYFSGLR